jgi:SAM-dependent methyltransferase
MYAYKIYLYFSGAVVVLLLIIFNATGISEREAFVEAYEYLSQVYNELMSDVDYDAWIKYIDGILKRYGVRSIFEAGCGTGIITGGLYRLGYDLTASDISPGMLKAASENARKNGHDITFVLQDMRHIEVGNKVDAVISACDGPNYLDAGGLAMFAASAYGALSEKGVLLFDISSKAKLRRMDGEVFFDDGDDASCIWQNTYDINGNSLEMDVTLFVRRGSLFERFTEVHTQYAYDPDFVKRVFTEAGFCDVCAFDCFTDNALGKDTDRIQFVCCKATA